MAPALRHAASVRSENPQIDAAMTALIHSESRGNPSPIPHDGVWGSTQVKDATGRAMAGKLGLPWRPDLMRGTSQAAIDYQYRIGRRYLEEGLQRYGNWADAFRFYHGGPDQSGWGTRTRTYAAYNLAKMRQLGAL